MVSGMTFNAAQQAIEARLKGHSLYLRGQWAPNKLQFDLMGVTSSPAMSAPFTLCGLDVKKIQLTADHLEIEGDRVGLEFENYNPKRVSLHTEIQIAVIGSPGADYGPALNKIFADGLPALVQDMPFYWQKYAQGHLLTEAPTSSGAYPRLPLPVHLPQLLENPEPIFTDASKQFQYVASCLVHVIVKTDGTVGDPYIVRPAGLGLDEEALRAVAHYRFKPGTRDDGSPVAVEINVEINFKIG